MNLFSKLVKQTLISALGCIFTGSLVIIDLQSDKSILNIDSNRALPEALSEVSIIDTLIYVFSRCGTFVTLCQNQEI